MYAFKLEKTPRAPIHSAADGRVVRIDERRKVEAGPSDEAIAAIAALLREKGVLDRVERG